MFPHHLDSIEKVTEKLKAREEVLAVIVCGSLAHGFARESSDVDLMIVIPEEAYLQRKDAGQLQYFERECCLYDGGYVDGKYLSERMLKLVREKGSEPARYAFQGCFVTYSQIDSMELLLKEIVRYPKERKEQNIRSFYAQLEAWKWYCEEAQKHHNRYLLNHSVSNLILFAGRLILAHNELLYPYHKWFLRQLENAPKKPEGMLSMIDSLLEEPNQESIDRLFTSVKEFRDWATEDLNWPSIFMNDSELNWINDKVPIADV